MRPSADDRGSGVAIDGGEIATIDRVMSDLGAPDQLGSGYEARLDVAQRQSSGAFFTPRAIAEQLIEFALPADVGPFSVCDPSVGGGAFLLAAARRLERFGLDRATIVRDHLWGADTDARAVAVTREALRRWSAEVGEPTGAGEHLVVTDSLLDDAMTLVAPDGGFDFVVGNPPFLNQLGERTARSPREARRLRERYGDALGPYTDTSALFVLAALDLVAPRGRIALILPESFLAARDAAGVRRRVTSTASLDGLWLADQPVFDANVDVCAPVLVRHPHRCAPVRRAVGPTFVAAAPVDDRAAIDRSASWAYLASSGLRAPEVALDETRTLGEMVRATAGFRDQYYALVDMVFEEAVVGEAVFEGGALEDASVESSPVEYESFESDPLDDGGHDRGRPVDDVLRPKLVTSGLIDPGVCCWGIRPTRFLRRAWTRPRVDLARLRAEHPKVARWADHLLVPKVVVATQTRVVEAAVDIDGSWYPSTPTIAVVAPVERLWAVAAVLLAPATSAWALNRVAGSALARDAIKMSASDVMAVPLPVDPEAWAEGADHLEAAVRTLRPGQTPVLGAFAEAMGRAYAASGEVEEWWTGRLPARRTADRRALTA